jgi:RNA polymerase sigma factor (TIGR02999 family)
VHAPLSALIDSADHHDPAASEILFARLYSELHRIARRELHRNGSDVTLGVTTLLHEAYLEISGREGITFPDRTRFMAYAARVMRGIIIDSARQRHAQKRGGLFELTSLAADVSREIAGSANLGELNEALDRLAAVDASLANIVDLKFFCGFSFAEIAAMRDVSERTVQRDWAKARIYLHRALREAPRN